MGSPSEAAGTSYYPQATCYIHRQVAGLQGNHLTLATPLLLLFSLAWFARNEELPLTIPMPSKVQLDPPMSPAIFGPGHATEDVPVRAHDMTMKALLDVLRCATPLQRRKRLTAWQYH